MSTEVTVKIRGQFFTVRDKPIQKALSQSIESVTRNGADRARSILKPGRGVRTGEYKASIHGTITKSGLGIGSIDSGNNILDKFLELGRYWPSTGHRFKGIFMFRKAKRTMNAIKYRVLNKYMNEAVAEINR